MDIDSLSEDSTLTSLSSSPPSSPLSSPPASPIPPSNWREITPPRSQDAGEDPRPPRKRRKIEPRTRITQHLDLSSENAQSEYDRQQALELLLKALRKRRKIVVVAGAGISVSAGIPDFRSSHGLFQILRGEHKLKGSGKQLFDASVYKDDSSTSNFHDMVRQLAKMAEDAKPTLFHRLVARLSAEGRLLRLYTQNVDGLDTSLPPLGTAVPLARVDGRWPKTVQLHGGIEKMMCQKCRQISDFDPTLFEGPIPPACPQCVEVDTTRTTVAGKRSHGIGRLRPRIVLYNEHNPDDEAIGSVTTSDFRTRPDAVVVVGTSMKIPGVRRIVSQMCRIVRDRREGTTIWINRDGVPTGKDLEDCWDLVVKGDSDEVARLAGLKEWDEPLSEVAEEYTDSDVEKIRSSQGALRVDIPTSPPKAPALSHKNIQDISVMTPPRSHNGDSEPRLLKKLPVSIKLKVAIPESNTASTGELLPNPVSQVRGTTVIKAKPGRPKGSKNKIKKEAGTATNKASTSKPGLGKMMSKVTKVQNTKPSVAHDLVKKLPLSPRRDSEINADSRPVPVPYSSTEPSPVPESPSATVTTPMVTFRTNQDTISPNGTVPKDLVEMLHWDQHK